VTTLAETYDPVFSALLETVRADALDCVQANLAVLADWHGKVGAHLELGAPLRFDTEVGPTGVPRVASSVPYRLAAAHDLLGLRVAERWDGVSGVELGDLVAEHGPLYVLGDAYDLAWTPYAGHQHTEHTFILSTSDTVVDAYRDETPWGPHYPGTWRISPGDLPPVTAFLLAADAVPARPGVLAANARAMSEALPAIATYLDANSAGSERVVLDIWLLGRSRLLHAAWLTRHGIDAEAADAQARAWLSFASQSYVAWRRGGLSPTVLAEMSRLLHEDVELAAKLAAFEVRPQHDVKAVVVTAIGEVLRVTEDTVRAASALRELPGFNSFRLVDIIERAETQLDVRLKDEDLTAESIRDVEALCAAFIRRAT
jgi:acyl carrier protein